MENESSEQPDSMLSIPVSDVRELFGEGTLRGQKIRTLVNITNTATILNEMSYKGYVAKVSLSVMVPSLHGAKIIGYDPPAYRDFESRVFAKALLYNTWESGEVHLIGVGRYPHNQLQPECFESIAECYSNFEQYDMWIEQCQSGAKYISREHGWVFISKDGKVMYRDVGTKMNGKRSGSTNGTWINGERQILDECIPWDENDYLGIGRFGIFTATKVRDVRDTMVGLQGTLFRLSYRMVGSDAHYKDTESPVKDDVHDG